MILSGKAKLAGVLGWPVGHSRSPRLHGFWLEHYGIDGAYLPLPVRPERFKAAVRALADLGFRGANVTVPHKLAAHELADSLTGRAEAIGAVNTLVFEDGRIRGDNTDGIGFYENLRTAAPRWPPSDGPAVVLGAGGAARAVLVALRDAGVPEIRLLNRTRPTAERLAAELGGGIRALDWERRPEALAEACLLVNTTSLGMTGQPALELDLAALPREAAVCDLVYAPLTTPLLAAAEARGNPTVDGLGMLLHQAVPGFAAWFGVEPQVTPALRAFVLAPG
ncbi:shikimate dehydrogenase [Tistlia consotensis]|uniref:Shikimate dehydrogenase (NADP(+)) n=1 Tax=Tistlia consotensis USBA 355 TaxID=560819 RepID=A0A1Y6BL93_9PROT|nr:shikimate dehydrogenase [Tistlia consotensis]SMF08956.1 shikimate dehydrogenase [Tistlia consotensis USBA 355]SNR34980.1 shikimate dehydrogenase [Tistlia consotensis]